MIFTSKRLSHNNIHHMVFLTLIILGSLACDESNHTIHDLEQYEGDIDHNSNSDTQATPDMEVSEVLDQIAEAEVIEDLPDPQNGIVVQRELIEWGTWWVTRDDNSGRLYQVLEQAQISEIIDGEAYGTTWSETELSEEGNLDVLRLSRSFYAMTKLTLNEESHFIMRLGAVVEMAVNGQRIPGDVYNMGRSLVPVTLPAGEHWIMLLVARRGIPNIKAWRVNQDLDFNLDDVTYSDLRIDDHKLESPLGLPILNFGHEALSEVEAWVLESDVLEASRVKIPSIPSQAVTQVPFEIKLKAPLNQDDLDREIEIWVQIQAANLSQALKSKLKLVVKAEDKHYRVSFRSPIDGSVQYYGVQAPLNYNRQESYASVLSLHGASVEAINQAGSYSPKDWAFIIAPTNRRPFGFDWEEWGHLNAVASLEHARSLYPLDPRLSYLVGHSMGGHGTWHVGAHHPGLFASLGPSAGWESFYSYGGASRPREPISWARSHSDTLNFMENLSQRSIYIIHGDQDESVPVSEGRNMYEQARQISDDVIYHEESGARHWWDGDASEGVDCVDWPPLFEFMRDRSFDPLELEFSFISASPAYSAQHSYLTISSAEYLGDSLRATSNVDRNQVSLYTENIRSMSIDLKVLRDQGIEELIVDGMLYELNTLDDTELWIGPVSGKQKDIYGNYNQVYQKPFCWIYPDGNEGEKYKNISSYLSTTWHLIGNGHACALPWSKLEIAENDHRNLIFIGFDSAWLTRERGWETHGITWDKALSSGITFPSLDADAELINVAGAGYVLRPSSLYEGLELALFASSTKTHLLYRLESFNSRGGLPDFVVIDDSGARLLGYYGMEWEWKPDWLLIPQD